MATMTSPTKKGAKGDGPRVDYQRLVGYTSAAEEHRTGQLDEQVASPLISNIIRDGMLFIGQQYINKGFKSVTAMTLDCCRRRARNGMALSTGS